MDDYFIGVHARELDRLREQDASWAPETRALWAAAGFGAGQHLADLGSGPGFTTPALARVVGPAGCVTAIDKASPYLDFLREEARRARFDNVRTAVADLTTLDAIDGPFDGAFCRFFLAFLIADLDRVLGTVHRSLGPGGALAAMEYLTLSSATCSPPGRGFDAHTRAWIEYYRAHGGDTSVGSYLPQRLARAGFAIEHVSCAGGMAHPGDRWWTWWGRLMQDFGETLAAGGFMSADELAHLRRDWADASQRSEAFMHTPLLLRVVARKR